MLFYIHKHKQEEDLHKHLLLIDEENRKVYRRGNLSIEDSNLDLQLTKHISRWFYSGAHALCKLKIHIKMDLLPKVSAPNA